MVDRDPVNVSGFLVDLGVARSNLGDAPFVGKCLTQTRKVYPVMSIIDRFEGQWAVIEYSDTTFNFPRPLLPKEAKEGDVLVFRVAVDTRGTDERRKRGELFE